MTDVAEYPTKEGALAAIDKSGVRTRQRWKRHDSGVVVEVVSVGISKANLEPTVGYAGADGIVWFLPLSMFIGRALKGNALVPRFTLCED